ncbi:hypothetical protein MSAR_07300 [Mycolicibacterium sarraceniae]|uniref:Pyridoxamine 5'-phosphate oxidase N-terminal domain-containing protein n=1 Tax=Mycolicibacterium sarraceniae TaxID=1534348 RepID=A0A7I7SKT1_9MYCO|nr:hypothetical protein MSAR_07300 [Mycolicibacterium sarraceniae]
MEQLAEEVIAFLSAGTRTAKLGYAAADGRPLVAPVWFVVEGNELVFNTGKDAAKGRALSRRPRVACAWTTSIPRSHSCKSGERRRRPKTPTA